MADVNFNALLVRQQQIPTEIKANDTKNGEIQQTLAQKTQQYEQADKIDRASDNQNGVEGDFDAASMDQLEAEIEACKQESQKLTEDNVKLGKELETVNSNIEQHQQLEAKAQEEAKELLTPFKEVFDGLKGDSTDEITPEMVNNLKAQLQELQEKYPDMKIYDTADGTLEMTKILSDGNLALVSMKAGTDFDQLFVGVTDKTEYGKARMQFNDKLQEATEGLSEKKADKVTQQMWAEFEQQCKDAGMTPDINNEDKTGGKFGTYMHTQHIGTNTDGNTTVTSEVRTSAKFTDINNYISGESKTYLRNESITKH